MQSTKNHPYDEQFDLEVVSELEDLGLINLIGAVALPQELDSTGNPIRATSFWVWFRNPLDLPNILPVEGKLYVPNRMSSTLIHYSPSGPVGNAGRFEKRYVADLVKAGYTVFTGRRNGASLRTEHAKEVMNTPTRIEMAERANETHIGGFQEVGYTPVDAVNEPIPSISGLMYAYDKIHLLSHSFGTSMHYHALTQFMEYQYSMSKFGNVVNIAGYVGKHIERENGIWDGTKVPAEKFGQIQVDEMRKADFNYNSAWGVNEYLMCMKQIAHNNENIVVPPHLAHIFFNCPQDPFIAGPMVGEWSTLKDYGPDVPNKLFISKHAPAGDLRPHSMDFITAAEIIAALEMKVDGISIENR